MRVARPMARRLALGAAVWCVACTTVEGAESRQLDEYGRAGFGFVVAQRVSDYQLTGPAHGGIAGEATFGTFLGVRIGGSIMFSDQHFGTEAFGITGGPGADSWELNSVVGTLGVGPQISLGLGPFRVYGYGTLGASYVSIWTSAWPGQAAPGGGIDFDQWTPAGELGGGMLIRVMGGSGENMPVYLDIGGRYADQGKSGWSDNDGTIGLHHLRIASVRVGVTFGLQKPVYVKLDETETAPSR